MIRKHKRGHCVQNKMTGLSMGEKKRNLEDIFESILGRPKQIVKKELPMAKNKTKVRLKNALTGLFLMSLEIEVNK